MAEIINENYYFLKKSTNVYWNCESFEKIVQIIQKKLDRERLSLLCLRTGFSLLNASILYNYVKVKTKDVEDCSQKSNCLKIHTILKWL